MAVKVKEESETGQASASQTAVNEPAATMAGGIPPPLSVPPINFQHPTSNSRFQSPKIPTGISNTAKDFASSASIFTKKGSTRLAQGLSNFLGGAIGAGGRGLGSVGLKAVNGGLDRWQAFTSAQNRFKTPSMKGAGGKAALAIFGAIILFMFFSGIMAGIGRPAAPTGEAAPIPGSVGIGSTAPMASANASLASQLSCATSMSARDINNFFDQKGYLNFQGTGQVFYDAAQNFKVNPALIIAIGTQESTLGIAYKGKPAENSKNAFGLMQSDSLMNFNSWADGINVAFRTVNSFNCSSLECIGQKYAPVGAKNDPDNLNQHWPDGVSKNFNAISQTSCAPLPIAETGADLPSGWPTIGQITQGPYEGFSHRGQNAIDISNDARTPVFSTLSGIVTQAMYTDPSPGKDYGVRIIIRNNQTGAEVLFGHLVPNSNSHLTAGQQVNKGDLIGLMDNTGFTTGSHLHYEIRGSIKDNPFSQYVPGGNIAKGTVIK